MFRSVFLRKMVTLVLVALCASALLSAFLFSIAANASFRTQSENDMKDKATSLSIFLSSYVRDNSTSSKDYLDTLLGATHSYTDPSILGAYFLLYNKDGSQLKLETPANVEDVENVTSIHTHATTYMLNHNQNPHLISRIPLDEKKTTLFIVQVPVMVNDELIAYLVIGSEIAQQSDIVKSFSNVLLLSTFVVAFFMIIPVYFASKRLVRPLNKVADVAIALGQGDFTKRADDSTRGEIGDLAASINELAERLSKSITSVTNERNRLKEIFDIISEGIVSVDINLQPDYANNAIATLFEKVPRKNLFTEKLQLIPFEEVWEDFENCIKTGESLERTIEAKDCAYQSTIVPTLDSDKMIIGATGFFRDISEQERLEQTRRDYVANVSHELRTPLTAMRGLVEPLADGMVKKEEDRQRYYGIILHETMRLSRLIDDMLELSRLQARTLAFKTFPFDLNKLLSEFETKFAPVMEEAELDFSVEFKTGPLPTVMGNPDRVEQIIVILLDNAKKYTPAGGSITISTEYNDETDQVLVSVSDTGQGIHEYDIDHIFDRFYKADRARGKKGTGLGLAIAKELLSYMGETITVTSEYGEGTTFTFTLKRVTGTVWY